MFNNLFKPKWQHKNPNIRIQALTKLSSYDAPVIYLSLSDEDSAVRQASIAYLTHVATLIKISQLKTTEAALGLARLKEILPQIDTKSDELNQVLALIDDESINTQMIVDAKYPIALRLQLLDKIQNPDLLRQIKKQSKQCKSLQKAVKNRLQAQAASIQKAQDLNLACEKMEQLKDLSNKAQLKDRFVLLKQTNQAQFDDADPTIQNRYQQAVQQITQQISADDAQEQQLIPRRKAYQGLIQSAATLLKQVTDTPFEHTKSSIEVALQLLKQAWLEVETLPTDEMCQLQQKFNPLEAEIVHIKNVIAKDLSKAVQSKKLVHQAEKLSQQKQAISQKMLDQLESAWQKAPKLTHIPQYQPLQERYQGALKIIQAKLKQQNNQKDQNLKTLLADLDQSEARLEENQIEAASKAFYHAQKILKNTPDIEKNMMQSIKQRIADIQPQIREMKKWRHWGTDQVRQNLIDEVQAFIDNDDSDAPQRAKDIKQFRQRWKKLDKMDGLASETLWQAFDALCNTAYEPCNAYFDEQAKIYQLNAEKRSAVCQQLLSLEQQIDWQNPSWREIDKQVKKYQKDWRIAGSVAHKDWQKINQDFNQAVQQIDEHLATERQANWLFREDLLKQAVALQAEADLEQAITQAKQIRKQWQVTVSSKPRKEQQLWKNFQAEIDNIFARVTAKKQESEQLLHDNLAQKTQICEQITALSQDDELLTKQAAFQALEQQYHQQGPIPNFNRQQIKKSFETACTQIDEKIKQLKHQQQIAELNLLAQKHQYCLSNEQQPEQTAVIDEWQKLPALQNHKLEKQLQHRFQKAQMAEDNEAVFAQKKQLCLDLEILLKLESPETEKAHRMQRQVELLDQQLSQRTDATDSGILIKQQIEQWFQLPSVEVSQQNDLNSRFTKIFKAYFDC